MKKMEWIPVTTRKLTRKEMEEAAERYGMEPEDFADGWVYTCPLPDDDQDVLITTRVWGYVVIDTFCIDEEGAKYFADHEDEGDVLAWMPLPDPYKNPLDHRDEVIRCKAEGCSPEGCKHCDHYEPIEFGGDDHEAD